MKSLIIFLLFISVSICVFSQAEKDVQKIKDLINLKKYTKAIKQIDRILENEKPQNGEIYYLKGICLASSKESPVIEHCKYFKLAEMEGYVLAEEEMFFYNCTEYLQNSNEG